ncbi:hypothetical protein LOTGIDRAFT_237495 [Lottia gigantea]|uniref:Uncharacterized protein n=1 Tax=Lottia gigantea TaxID=225164 RepID=V4B1H9_LOTGI|nr:hypothetical protein LOTGIDRAFT_237495 [Lottia gigantea]ESP04198.1 hypothetical protein LOTGIDRAFT_237495 [Lottia gigantea]
MDFHALRSVRMRFIDAYNQELEEQRNLNRQSTKDKMVAVARAKEMMREQTSGELTRFKDKIKEEKKNEIVKLKEEVKSLEMEVEKLREEKQDLCRVEREFSHNLDRTERTVINEINEECRRSASVLGISPRKVHLASFKKESTPVNETKSSKYRTPITSSLANLRACNEELRTHLYEIKQEVESLRSLLNKAQKEKEESMEILRRKLEKEKNDELDHLKERLVREHISQMNRLANQYISEPISSPDPVQSLITSQPNITSTPKSDFYIQRFQQEMQKEFIKYSTERAVSPELKHINDLQQQEIARLEREIQKLSLDRSGNRKPPRPRGKKDIANDKLGEKFPYKLHHFDTESSKLQSNLYTGSVPDLSNPSLYRQVPLKARLSAERDDMESAHFTDPDPELSQIFLPQNRKLSEMNKLQTTLTNQNKELLDLERAYNQLNRSYNQRSASPSVHFRSSR